MWSQSGGKEARGELMELLTFEKLCGYLGASKKTIYNYINAGMPYIRPLGKGKKFFDKEKVDLWLLRYELPHNKLVRRK